MKGLKKNLYEIYLEASHFLKKVYPDFVTSRKPDRIDGIPVFTFHTIRPEIFKEQLEFLKENNYVTVGLDDFYSYLIGEKALAEKAILLTIDDGRMSVWEYGVPLLKEYGFRATVFVIPGHTKDKALSPSPPFNFPLAKGGYRGVEGGRGGLDEIKDEGIFSWQEISMMNDSGIIDFGSHTLYHQKIFTDSEIIDFLIPGQKILPYDYPAVPEGFESFLFEKGKDEFFGMPIYSNDSLMSGKPRYVDDPELREECIRYYREKFIKTSLRGAERLRGEAEANSEIPRFARNRLRNLRENEIATPFGLAMTESAGWKKEMFRFSSEYRKSRGRACPALPERFSTLEETAKEIYDNLYISKKILEEKLGKPVNHLCYPFGIWSDLSNEMAKKAGYLSSFCAYIPGKPINKSGGDPHKIVRLKDDYIFRLPGKGRKSLAEIFLHKFKRRIKGERVY